LVGLFSKQLPSKKEEEKKGRHLFLFLLQLTSKMSVILCKSRRKSCKIVLISTNFQTWLFLAFFDALSWLFSKFRAASLVISSDWMSLLFVYQQMKRKNIKLWFCYYTFCYYMF